MFGHLGAKVGEQGRKMQQLSEKVGLLEAWRGGGTDASTGNRGGGTDASTGNGSRAPPLKKLQRKGLELPPPPGAPNSTWKLVELRLWMELSTDRDTQHVPEGTWRIYIYIIYFYIDIYMYIYIYIYSLYA